MFYSWDSVCLLETRFRASGKMKKKKHLSCKRMAHKEETPSPVADQKIWLNTLFVLEGGWGTLGAPSKTRFVTSLSFLSLFFLEKGTENPQKTRIFYPCRTPEIPGKEGKNAKKNKEFLAKKKKKKNKEFQKNKERKDRVAIFISGRSRFGSVWWRFVVPVRFRSLFRLLEERFQFPVPVRFVGHSSTLSFLSLFFFEFLVFFPFEEFLVFSSRAFFPSFPRVSGVRQG